MKITYDVLIDLKRDKTAQIRDVYVKCDFPHPNCEQCPAKEICNKILSSIKDLAEQKRYALLTLTNKYNEEDKVTVLIKTNKTEEEIENAINDLLDKLEEQGKDINYANILEGLKREGISVDNIDFLDFTI